MLCGRRRDLAFGGGIPNVVFAAGWAGLRSTMVTAPPDNTSKDPDGPTTPIDRAQGFGDLDVQMYTEIELGGLKAFDSPFWQERAPSRLLKPIVKNRVPALMLTGWFDVYQRGVVLNYAALQNTWARLHPKRARRRPARFGPMLRGQRTTPRYQVVEGPWFHNPVGTGEWIQEIHLEWFDHWLRGERTKLGTHAHALPRLRAARRPLARRERLPAAQDEGEDALARRRAIEHRAGVAERRRPERCSRRPRRSGADTIAWSDAASACNRHPDQWSTGFGGTVAASTGFPANRCAQDDTTMQAGALAYTTEPFEQDTTLAGPVTVGVEMSSTTRDSVLVATLEDVAPNGSSYPLTTGALLGSHRALDERTSWRQRGKLVLPGHPYTRAKRADLEPGEVERQEIEVYPGLRAAREGASAATDARDRRLAPPPHRGAAAGADRRRLLDPAQRGARVVDQPAARRPGTRSGRADATGATATASAERASALCPRRSRPRAARRRSRGHGRGQSSG